MKKTIVLTLVAVFLISTAALAQPFQTKKWEFSTALSFTSLKFSGDTESEWALNIPLRIGYTIWKGLEIEPEFMITKFKGSDAGYLISGNLAYNFVRTGSALVPFILGGVGFGNGFSYFGVVEGSSDVNAFAINGGAGIKYLIGNTAALRLEYRYTHYHFTEELFEPSNLSSHQILAGLSIFF